MFVAGGEWDWEPPLSLSLFLSGHFRRPAKAAKSNSCREVSIHSRSAAIGALLRQQHFPLSMDIEALIDEGARIPVVQQRRPS